MPKNNDDSKLKKLVAVLERDISKDVAYTRKIKHPKLLIHSMKQLDTFIGNARVKDSLADQVGLLIHEDNDNGDDYERQDVMLNSMLCGPPGVGKTSVAYIIARVWYSLGYLRTPSKKSKRSKKKSWSQQPGIEDLVADMWLASIACVIVTSVIAMIFPKYRRAITVAGVVVFAAIALYIWFTSGVNWDDLGNDVPVSSRSSRSNAIPNDEDIMTVVTRDDLVAEYVGQTGQRTRKVLEDSRGKVLFIDEAYNLCKCSRDSFGMEALTTITDFVSRYPNDIIVIMAGYKHELLSGPLRVQPGLRRRMMNIFECDPYTGEELALIFEHQARKKGLTLDSPKEIRRFIALHKDDFPSFGGDTEKLVFFARIENSNDSLADDNVQRKRITLPQVKRALTEMKRNQVYEKDIPQELVPLRELLSQPY